MNHHPLGRVEKSEHGPLQARAQRLFDATDPVTAESLLFAAIGPSDIGFRVGQSDPRSVQVASVTQKA